MNILFYYLLNLYFYLFQLFLIFKEIAKNKLCYKKDSISIENAFLITKDSYENLNLKSNWKNINEDGILKIYYKIILDNIETKYIICYKCPHNIKFPPYTLDEIKTTNHKKSIIFAECDDKDYTNICKLYAGPFEDFYKNVPNVITKKNMFIHSDKVLTITNSDMDEFIFNDEIKL